MKTGILVATGLTLLVAGFAAGSWFVRSQTADASRCASPRAILYYVDPMNPAHTSDKPGLAPCGMAMEPVYADPGAVATPGGGGAPLPGAVRISTWKQQLIGVRVRPVEGKALELMFRMAGRVAADETRVYRINATVDGWITKAGSLATGSPVRKDQTLAAFYSPEFLSAAQALLFALTSQDRVQAAGSMNPAQSNQLAQFNLNLQQYRDSLRNLGMSALQIEEMIRTRRFMSQVNITAPADGFITARSLSDGQRFEKGSELFRIVDLSRVWILVDVFEREARHVRSGLQARVTLPNQGQSFPAVVSDALPQFDRATRTLKVRLEADNPDFTLKPDMFVDVELAVTLPESLVVPADAILDAGLRQTVFVDRGNGFFEPRVVQTGARNGGAVQILQGLMAGERIVVSGNFLLDSESRMKLAATGVHGAPVQDPVCGMAVDEQKARAANRIAEHRGKTYFFCCDSCKEEFAANPARFLEGANSSSTASTPVLPDLPPVMNQDPVCGMMVNEQKARVAGRIHEYGGQTYLFCNDGCKEKFMADPEKFLNPAAMPAASSTNAVPHRDQSHR